MKTKHSLFNFLTLMTFIIIMHLPFTAFAKEINLYDQPQSSAKIIAKIDLATGIIPIYTPKETGWIKVADPKNGNVGWAKSNDLSSIGASQTTLTFTQSTTTHHHKSPITYQIIQFGQPKTLTAEQTQSMIKEAQMQQQAIQKSMRNMLRDMDQLFYNNWHFMHAEHFPLLIPTIILPVQKTTNTIPSQPLNQQAVHSKASIPTTTQKDISGKIDKK
ncbi:MAG: hypothetical protein KIT56_01660 [Gammaproteobacteria bacterium]|nr:hypothetical protein [Gammaproteobacteria bacterium]MCW5582590.1 hypothetical protein [Gammaproteobacteria bacterium]